MNLWDAPFSTRLEVLSYSDLPDDARQVLSHLGLDIGETIEKVHKAPLGDPLSVRIGEQLFTLRSEVCRKIQVRAS